MKQPSSRQRRQWIEFYLANGRKVSATCRHFGISRSTLYRWLSRYDSTRPQKPLMARSRRPHTKRRPSWSLHHLAVLADMMSEREDSQWGRRRWQAALAHRGWQVSEATVGRMIAAIKRWCPICKGRGGKHNIPVHIWGHDATSLLGPDFLPLARPPGYPRRRT